MVVRYSTKGFYMVLQYHTTVLDYYYKLTIYRCFSTN